MAKCLNILEIVFGAWVLLSVPLLGCASAALAVDLMAGALIVVLAGVSTGMKEYNPGCDWALVFVGCAFAVWGIADAAASLGGAPVNEIIFGLLVALVAFGATRFTTVYDGVGLDDLVQISDAQLFFRQLLDGFARCGTDAHLHGEGLGGLLERVVNLDGRRLAIELDDAVGELFLGYLHKFGAPPSRRGPPYAARKVCPL